MFTNALLGLLSGSLWSGAVKTSLSTTISLSA